MYERLGEEPRSRIIFSTYGSTSYKWKNHEGEVDQRLPYMSLEEVRATTHGDTSNRRRMHTQELIRHVFMLCEACVPQGRAPRGWQDSHTMRFSKTDKEKEKGTMALANLSALSQRLLNRWRDRARVRLGASNNHTRSRIWTACVVDSCDPII